MKQMSSSEILVVDQKETFHVKFLFDFFVSKPLFQIDRTGYEEAQRE